MSVHTNRAAKQEYRRRLRDAGRREVLIDLPAELLDTIDKIGSPQRRALVVEALVRRGLDLADTQTA